MSKIFSSFQPLHQASSLSQATSEWKKTIKLLMTKEGIKVSQVASDLGIDAQVFSNWLYRGNDPTVQKMDNVLHCLGYHLAVVDNKSGEIVKL